MILRYSTPSIDEPVDAAGASTSDTRSNGSSSPRWLEVALLVLAAAFFFLHFVHLKADFPNYSLWMDWSKYTDEGWYGDAAIRHFQLGHWNVPGDFNPAAALPVWPALELVLFRFAGVSLVAARALTVTVFGLILVQSYFLIRRWAPQRSSLAPAIAVLLLSVSPFCFVFSRLAILEPPLILLTLAAMLTASWNRESDQPWTRHSMARAAVLGLLLPLIILTKTTGLFLFPAIVWLLWASCNYRVKPFLRASFVATLVGIAAWVSYYLLIVRPRYLVDYRYLFSANAYTGITPATFWNVMHDALFDTTWIGWTLFVLAVAAMLYSLVSLAIRRAQDNPLTVALLLWIIGYAAFLIYHANLQPRYYLVLAVPLMMLVAVAWSSLMAASARYGGTVRLITLAAGAALVFSAANGARQTIGFVRRPEYRWVSAAAEIREAVDREAAVTGHSRLVLSISGSDLALMQGLPSICDDFGTLTLPERVTKYRPGWFATWNDVEDDKMDALAPLFRLVRVATIPVFDDPDRNLLILYRLDPVTSPGRPGRAGRRRYLSVPHRRPIQMSPMPLKH